MELFQALVLGIVQGVTEFFPISSSGHLIIIPKIFNWSGIIDTLSFDVSLHLGTLTALVFFFWKDWAVLIESFLKTLFSDTRNILKNENSRLFTLLLIGSIPAGVIGFLFKDFIEENTRNTFLIGLNLIIFGFLLWYFDKKGKEKRNIKNINMRDTIIIGIAQSLALIPGVSRSGVTITAARANDIDRESSVRFSFLLSTPAILGAGLVSAKEMIKDGLGNYSIFLVGFIAAAVSGYLAIKFLILLSRRDNFNIFVYYRYLLGAFLIFFSLFFG